MKLEHKIKDGVFSRKKLYAIINDKDKLIIKASGADKNKLTFDDILNLLRRGGYLFVFLIKVFFL